MATLVLTVMALTDMLLGRATTRAQAVTEEAAVMAPAVVTETMVKILGQARLPTLTFLAALMAAVEVDQDLPVAMVAVALKVAFVSFGAQTAHSRELTLLT